MPLRPLCQHDGTAVCMTKAIYPRGRMAIMPLGHLCIRLVNRHAARMASGLNGCKGREGYQEKAEKEESENT